jgi:PAS domain S-box-containing protein
MDVDAAQFSVELIRRAADAIIYADRDGVIRVWNAAAVRIFGFAEQEAIGQSLDLIIPQNLRERHWHGFERTMRSGESRYGDGDTLAVPALRKDGTRISVEFTIAPFRDDGGTMLGIAAILRDVTARFKQTRALQREIAALRGGSAG